MLTIPEIAKQFNLSEQTIRNYLRRGLSHAKEYKGLRYVIKIDPGTLQRFIDRNMLDRESFKRSRAE